jgi:hypothetical protein
LDAPRDGSRRLDHPTLIRPFGPPSPNGRRDREGEIDPGVLIPHTIKREDGPGADTRVQDKTDGCIKVVINP